MFGEKLLVIIIIIINFIYRGWPYQCLGTVLPSHIVYSDTNVLSLLGKNTLQITIIMFKYMQNSLPASYDDIFITYEIHQYQTR